MASNLSSQLQEFIRQRLASVDQVEIVLLLMKDPARSWTALEVAAAVGSAPESAAMRLFLLASSGLIAFEPSTVPRYRYLETDPGTAATLMELAGAWTADRPSVVALIGGPPVDPIRSFADAFKLKK